MTFFLSAFGSTFSTLVFTIVASGTASADTLYVLSLITTARTRKLIVGLSVPWPLTDATSSTTFAPAGIDAPLEPVIALFTVATIFSPGSALVQILDPLVAPKPVPEPMDATAGAAAGAGAGAIATGCGTGCG